MVAVAGWRSGVAALRVVPAAAARALLRVARPAVRDGDSSLLGIVVAVVIFVFVVAMEWDSIGSPQAVK